MTTLLRLGAGVTLALLVTSCSSDANAPRGHHDEHEAEGSVARAGAARYSARSRRS